MGGKTLRALAVGHSAHRRGDRSATITRTQQNGIRITGVWPRPQLDRWVEEAARLGWTVENDARPVAQP